MSHSVDIRTQVCPMTWVRVKLALEALAPGEVLDVLLRGDEPLRSVPRSAAAEGHVVLEARPEGADFVVQIRKGGAC